MRRMQMMGLVMMVVLALLSGQSVLASDTLHSDVSNAQGALHSLDSIGLSPDSLSSPELREVSRVGFDLKIAERVRSTERHT